VQRVIRIPLERVVICKLIKVASTLNIIINEIGRANFLNSACEAAFSCQHELRYVAAKFRFTFYHIFKKLATPITIRNIT
jgi:hypothetical protein